MLNRDTIITYLQEHKADFTDKYSIDKIGLFRSFTTEENVYSSDKNLIFIILIRTLYV